MDDQNEELEIAENVRLNNAVMIIGLSGWGNAGEVSTFTVQYLVKKLKASKFGLISPDNFHHYQINRPMVSIEQGIIQSYSPPKNDLFYYSEEEKVNLVLLLGSEPHLNWPRYTQLILDLAKKLDVKRVLTIGGYLADVHHENDPLITASTNNKELIDRLKMVRAEFTNYTGPTSVYSEIHWKARQIGLDVISLWCAVPVYIGSLFPKAVYQLLKKITMLIGMDLNFSDLEKRSEDFDSQISKETLAQPQLRNLTKDRKRGIDNKSTYIS